LRAEQFFHHFNQLGGPAGIRSRGSADAVQKPSGGRPRSLTGASASPTAIQIVERHARQRADIHMQFAAGADTVGGIAAVDSAQVERWVRDGERLEVIALFQQSRSCMMRPMASCISSIALTPRAGSLEWPDWP
jgi:hypothetical protein